MTTSLQNETPPTEVPASANSSDTIITVVGIFLVMILVWVTVKGKLRDWFMR
jgi:hypothetical protein